MIDVETKLDEKGTDSDKGGNYSPTEQITRPDTCPQRKNGI